MLLADVEGSTRLWQTQSEQMETVIAALAYTVSEIVAAHGGVQSIEQGAGDSFVVAFDRASDAAACALDLQRAALAPIRLRIGLHTGEVQLRDEGYVGSTINRAARLRDLGHGGQTLLSATTSDLAIDVLPTDAWLIDLGSHPLRELARPERVFQMCHPDLQKNFPPLRTSKAVAISNLPPQITTFVGGDARTKAVRELLAKNRLVTLTGEGGVGKTRLAIQIAAGSEFHNGVWYVDLAPLTDPTNVPIAVIRALGLTDQPGRSTDFTISHFIGDRHKLMVLDNCEHVLDACAELVVTLLGACPALTVLATSRESMGVAGEVAWRVPSLSLAGGAIELFVDRAGLVQPAFSITDDNAEAVSEICRRLDGIPLAIELAAARVRSLSPAEIADGLDDRFRLLACSTRTAVRRQQTLRASMDWSHALLTPSERMLFRRLAVFPGSFDLAAARVVAGGSDFEFYQVLDQLTLLVDKSLVLVEDIHGRTRYRLLETVREYALERLDESCETDLPARHCDYYKTLAALLDTPGRCDRLELVEQAEIEIHNLRAAFTWNRKNGDWAGALQLASELQPIWFGRGRQHEGLRWFDSILERGNTNQPVVPAGIWARALADSVMLDTLLTASPVPATHIAARAHQALAIARDIDDSAALVRALTACGYSGGYNTEAAQVYLREAMELANALDDKWTLSQVLYGRLIGSYISGQPIALRAAAQQAHDLAASIGDRFVSRQSRLWRTAAQMWEGDLNGAIEGGCEVIADAAAATDTVTTALGLYIQALALAHRNASEAEAVASACIEAAAELGGVYEDCGYAAMSCWALAAGDPEAIRVNEAVRQKYCAQQAQLATHRELMAQLALARGDVTAARRYADDAVHSTSGWHLKTALITRARVEIAQSEPEAARDDAHAALLCVTGLRACLCTPDAIELLAEMAGGAGRHWAAARLFGAAAALRRRTDEVRFKIWDAGYEAAVAALRDAMGGDDFASAWAEGAALSTDEAIVYAQRGRGKRKRPARGWDSLTPAELNVVRLVGEGLGNRDIATRLLVSPHTVRAHLSHVYAKLGISSRVQLAQEAARHS
ncbi:Putative HTH-type transcriptional regulator [Mycobacterium simulans]|uniref:HTH-type transcriptional regulator n=2 Tax=Mycobacterium simulans TaxID=627089 RepID=A0A7Z7IJL9_9MYCO|nr:Putative HTH-type transcriptional regulator [Mycobacterium simulans]